jgi:hypothetical protein
MDLIFIFPYTAAVMVFLENSFAPCIAASAFLINPPAARVEFGGRPEAGELSNPKLLKVRRFWV